ncbi:hypothetical protein SynA1562_00194 [Synechococcus sp. A15-62]|nr:hypothetical protein SynA1562_00194 [Synechococcus sp. A15-62]
MVHRPSLGVVKAGQEAHGWRLVVLRCLQRRCDGLPLIFDLTQALRAKVVDLVKSIPDQDFAKQCERRQGSLNNAGASGCQRCLAPH